MTVASDPTVSRRIDALAGDVERGGRGDPLGTGAGPRAAAEMGAAPTSGALPVDIDATILIAHSDKEDATPTYNGPLGHAPLLAYLDHGEGGTGEPLAVKLRPGRANANNAVDNIAVLREALTQLPADERNRVLVRTDAAGGTHAFLAAGHRAGLGVLGRVRGHRTGRRRRRVTCPNGRGPRPMTATACNARAPTSPS